MQEQQYRQPSAPFQTEEVKRLQQEELKRALQQAFPGWSKEQLEVLSMLYRERGWTLFLAYLDLVEAHLNNEMWKVGQDDRQSTFLRGQKHMLDKLRKAPVELEKVLEARKELDV